MLWLWGMTAFGADVCENVVVSGDGRGGERATAVVQTVSPLRLVAMEIQKGERLELVVTVKEVAALRKSPVGAKMRFSFKDGSVHVLETVSEGAVQRVTFMDETLSMVPYRFQLTDEVAATFARSTLETVRVPIRSQKTTALWKANKALRKRLPPAMQCITSR